MRSNPIQHWRNFKEDVDREITFLVTQHRDEAYAVALKALAKPNLRTRRRKVLAAVARALDPTPRLFGLFRIKTSAGRPEGAQHAIHQRRSAAL
jgi:hypothetical protein